MLEVGGQGALLAMHVQRTVVAVDVASIMQRGILQLLHASIISSQSAHASG